MNTRLFIFDMDGVILDSEPLNRQMRRKISMEVARGKAFTVPTGGMGLPVGEYYYQLLQQLKGDEPDPAKVAALRRKHFSSMVEAVKKGQVKASEGLDRLLLALRERGVTLAVASSADEGYVNGVLAALRLERYFSFVVAGNQITQPKPHPEIYAEALKCGGMAANRAMAMEDSPAGVRAADAAGIRCLAYVREGSGQLDYSGAFAVVHSMDDVLPHVD